MQLILWLRRESWQEKWHWVSSVACRWWAPSFEAVLDCTRCSPLCAGWEQPGVGWPPFGGKPWLCWNEASDTRNYGCSLLSSELSCLRIKVVGNLNIEYKREKDTKSLLCSFFFPSFLGSLNYLWVKLGLWFLYLVSPLRSRHSANLKGKLKGKVI